MSRFFSFIKSKRTPPPTEQGQEKKACSQSEDDNGDNEGEPIVRFDELQYLEEGGHKDIVRNLICVDIAEGRKRYLISSSDDARICVWDVQSGQLVHALLGHTRPVTCMLVLDNRPKKNSSTLAQSVTLALLSSSSSPSPLSAQRSLKNSLLLISGSSDKTIKVWDILRGVLVQDLKEHNGSVRSLLAVNCYLESRQSQYVYGGTPQGLLSEIHAQQQQQQQGHYHQQQHQQQQQQQQTSQRRKFRVTPSVFRTTKFCSGANDKYICLWEVTDSGIVLSGKIPQYEDESKK